MRNDKQKVIRVAAGAGRWFPADGAALRSMINGYLGKAPPAPVTGRIVAAITPHAGYQYSGATAAHVFRAIRDQAAIEAADRAGMAMVFTGVRHFRH